MAIDVESPGPTLQGGAPVRERVQLVYKYYFTTVDEWGLYYYSYWD